MPKTKYDEACDVLRDISSHARFAVGTAAPTLKGLEALSDKHGTAAETLLPAIVCSCGISDADLYDAVMAGARLVLAPLGGTDPDDPLPATVRHHVYRHADDVLSWLNRMGERILAAGCPRGTTTRGDPPKKDGARG